MKMLTRFLKITSGAKAASVTLSLLCGSASAQQVIFQIHGHAFADNLAISSGVGDINHDDVPDVLVSSSFHSTLRLYSGRTHDLIREIVGELGPTHTLALGASIDGAGDFDADGTLDLAAGAPGDSQGGVLAAGSARVYSGRNGHEIARWNGQIETAAPTTSAGGRKIPRTVCGRERRQCSLAETEPCCFACMARRLMAAVRPETISVSPSPASET